MKYRITWMAGLFALMMLASTPALAVDDPALDYYTIETPNFYVHYYSGLEDFAWRVAINCEEAHEVLSPLLDWKPASKTHVNVIDRVDSANGSAGTFGRNRMTIYAMPPEASSVLGFYDDWIRVVVYHEYVHILHIDTVLGISPYLNIVLGKQLSPNQTLPRWYTEGIATYHESMRTRGGRVKGTTWNTWSRTAALEGKLFDLGTTTGTPVAWPGGTSAYLYGSLFIDYVANKHGEDFIRRFNHIYGGRIIPYSLNQASSSISGQTIQELWNEWLAHAHARAHAERIAVVAAGETRLEIVDPAGGSTGFPRFRPKHDTVTYYSSDLVSDSQLMEVAASAQGEQESLLDIESGYGAGSWTPDGGTYLFSQSDGIENIYVYQDIFAWNAETQRTYRLTKGERAREPAVSPDGKKFAYVRNLHGTMELVVRDLNNPSAYEKVLVSGADHPPEQLDHWNQISLPEWSPDSRRVVFSMWRLGDGFRDIWMATPTRQGTTLERLTRDFAMDIDPSFGPDGRIYFSSDRTGIFNIYAIDPETRQTWKVSNVVTGVNAPRVSPDGEWIWVTKYTASGNAIARFRHPEKLEPAPASVKDRLASIEYPDVDTSDWVVEEYQPIQWLAPLTFTPEFGIATGGGAFGATLSSSDPVNRHLWQATAATTFAEDIAEQNASLALSYTYGGLPVDVGIFGRYSEFPRLRTYFAESEFKPYLQEQYLSRITLSYPMRAIDDVLTLSLSYEIDRATFGDLPAVEPDPGDLEPSEAFEGWFNEARLSLSYSNAERYSQSISVEEGVQASVSVSAQDPVLGSDFQTFSLFYNGAAFIPNPWIDRHVFSLSLSGGHLASTGSPGVFSLGGTRPQDVFSSILFQEPQLGRVIRGYPPAFTRGRNFQLYQADYRFPIFDFDKGFATLPIFFRQLKGTVFAESGTAYSGFLADADLLSSAGAELLLQTTFGYYFTGNLRLGYARGFTEGGIHEFYMLYGGGF